MEIWKSIPNYNKYEVSADYRVRNKKTGYMLKVFTTIYEYPYSRQIMLKHDTGGDGTVFLDKIVPGMFADGSFCWRETGK